MEPSTQGPSRDEHDYGMAQLHYQQAVLTALLAASQGFPIPPGQRVVLLDLARQLGENAASALALP